MAGTCTAAILTCVGTAFVMTQPGAAPTSAVAAVTEAATSQPTATASASASAEPAIAAAPEASTPEATEPEEPAGEEPAGTSGAAAHEPAGAAPAQRALGAAPAPRSVPAPAPAPVAVPAPAAAPAPAPAAPPAAAAPAPAAPVVLPPVSFPEQSWGSINALRTSRGVPGFVAAGPGCSVAGSAWGDNLDGVKGTPQHTETTLRKAGVTKTGATYVPDGGGGRFGTVTIYNCG